MNRVPLRPSKVTGEQLWVFESRSALNIMLKVAPESRITSVGRRPMGPLARRMWELISRVAIEEAGRAAASWVGGQCLLLATCEDRYLVNRPLCALIFESLSLNDHEKSSQFVQRILNFNHSDSLKISASQMLFGNMLNLDEGIFTPQ